MNDHLKIVSTPPKADWLELVISIGDERELICERIDKLQNVFTDITVLSTREREDDDPEYVKWITFDSTISRSEVWNQKVQTSEKPWIFFVDQDEIIDINSFPEQDFLSYKKWTPTLFVHNTGPDTFRQYYQIRLVPKSDQPIFGGNNIPDATEFILENGIELSSIPLIIFRDTEPMDNTDPDEELSIQNFSPQIYLQLGNSYYEEKKYVYAAAQYRRLLKMEKLLSYDRLAALNGLAGCFVETYKWQRAIDTAQSSIEIESMQYLPYLIQYRIYQLNKQWDQSLHALEAYLEALNSGSKANYDKYISREETLLKLGKLSINTGDKEKALKYYESYYRLKNGIVDPEFLNMLLVLSIEQSNYRKSVYFFKEMFEDSIPDKLTAEQQHKLNEFLSMFMVNGWYDYPFEMYEQLYEEDSKNSEYRRRLIVTLSKTNRIEKAKKIIASNL